MMSPSIPLKWGLKSMLLYLSYRLSQKLHIQNLATSRRGQRVNIHLLHKLWCERIRVGVKKINSIPIPLFLTPIPNSTTHNKFQFQFQLWKFQFQFQNSNNDLLASSSKLNVIITIRYRIIDTISFISLVTEKILIPWHDGWLMTSTQCKKKTVKKHSSILVILQERYNSFLPLSPPGWRGIVVTVRAGGRLPDLRNPYLCNRLTDFLCSKFCGIV